MEEVKEWLSEVEGETSVWEKRVEGKHGRGKERREIFSQDRKGEYHFYHVMREGA